MRTGIPFSTWTAESPRAIATALELIEEGQSPDAGVVASG